MLYHLNVAYQNYGGFADFVNGQTISIAPVISYQFSDATSLKFEYEYNYNERTEYSGLPLDPASFKLPITRNFNYPDPRSNGMSHELTLSLDHKFSDRLSLHTALAGTFFFLVKEEQKGQGENPVPLRIGEGQT